MSGGLRVMPRRQRGLGLPTAIFVITVMALLTVAINRLVSTGAEDASEAVAQTRALHAAESGAGFGLNALFPPAQYPDYQPGGICPDNTASPRVYAFDQPSLGGCRAEVSCETGDQVNGVTYYTITSTGICGAVRRNVEVRAFHEP